MVSPLEFGESLADLYTIEREIGRGGMATVYLAHDRKHNRPVAIKVLMPQLAAVVGPDRFLREIEIAARLNHPHILPLHDSGEAAGSLYYVMPLVEGETLRDRLNREKQLSVAEAVRIAREIADGLGHAHSHGVIHRDIKPENILLSGGHAVISDFGIARAISASGGEQLTQTGFAIGTPAYMSPEQAVGQSDLDTRSDVYSLACVLHEMLTGTPPHGGPTAQAIIAKRLSEAVPSIRATRDTVSEALDLAVRQALARVPADRYLSAAQFADALSAAGTSASHAPRIGRAAAAIGIYALSALAMLGIMQALVGWLQLPNWALPATLVLLLLALPIALTSGLLDQRPSPAGGAPRILTKNPAVLSGVLASAGLGVVIVAYTLRAPPSPLDSTRLAVLPFSVRGDTSFEYLAEGIVDLLARSLDGAGNLHTVDPGTVLSALGRDETAAADPEHSRAVARRVGAGVYLMGTVHAIGGRLRIQAGLYDARASEAGVAVSQLGVEGDNGNVLALVDQLAAQVLVEQGAAPGHFFETATLTTRSLAALKAYLTAEEMLRSGPALIDSALANLERAVAEDSTFALAYYRMAVAAGWQGRHQVAAAATANALRHSTRLANRDRRLLEAYSHYRGGSVDLAEAQFRALLRDYPDDLEAGFQLADLLTHYNPLRGRSQAEARELFSHVLAYDPGFL